MSKKPLKPLHTFSFVSSPSTFDIVNTETMYSVNKQKKDKTFGIFKNEENILVFKGKLGKAFDAMYYKEILGCLIGSIVEVGESIISRYQEQEVDFLSILKFDANSIDLHSNLSIKKIHEKIGEAKAQLKVTSDEKELSRIHRKLNLLNSSLSTFSYYLSHEMEVTKAFLTIAEDEFKILKLESHSSNFNGVPTRVYYANMYTELMETYLYFSRKLSSFNSAEITEEEKAELVSSSQFAVECLHSLIEYSKEQRRRLVSASSFTSFYPAQAVQTSSRLASYFISSFLSIYKAKITEGIFILRSQLLNTNSILPNYSSRATKDYNPKLSLRKQQLTKNKDLLAMFNRKPPQRRDYNKINACQKRIVNLESEVIRLSELCSMCQLHSPKIVGEMISTSLAAYRSSMEDFITDNGLVGFFRQNFIIEFSVKVHLELRTPPQLVFHEIPQMNAAKKTLKCQQLRDQIFTKLTDYEALLHSCEVTASDNQLPKELLNSIPLILRAEKEKKMRELDSELSHPSVYEKQAANIFKELSSPMKRFVNTDILNSLIHFNCSFSGSKSVASSCTKSKTSGFNKSSLLKKMEKIQIANGTPGGEFWARDMKALFNSKKLWNIITPYYPDMAIILESKKKANDKPKEFITFWTFEEITTSLAEMISRYFLNYLSLHSLSIDWRSTK